VKFAEPLLGWIPGGLAILCVWTCAFFTVFTGASGVTIVALGGLLLPELERSRYPKRFSIEVVTGSGAIGLLFPPALPLIVYGIVFGLNAGRPTSTSRSSASSRPASSRACCYSASCRSTASSRDCARACRERRSSGGSRSRCSA
jgi:hypothetical protein